MNVSAARSSSDVVTPSRSLPSRSLSVRTRMAPAAAIFSISSGDFLMITRGRRQPPTRAGAPRTRSQLVLQPQRGDRRPEVVVDLRGRARAVEAAQEAALVVVVDERRGLGVEDVEPVADGLFLVVVALDQRRPVDVADVVDLG